MFLSTGYPLRQAMCDTFSVQDDTEQPQLLTAPW